MVLFRKHLVFDVNILLSCLRVKIFAVPQSQIKCWVCCQSGNGSQGALFGNANGTQVCHKPAGSLDEAEIVLAIKCLVASVV